MKRLTILLLGLATFTVADDAQEIIKANNAFSPDIYKELYNDSKPNYLVSTFSAFNGLSMLLSGSEGHTKLRIANALKISLFEYNYEIGIKDLLKSMNSSSYTLNLANGLFIHKDYLVANTYVEKVKDIYQASVNGNLSFANQEIVSKNINDWIKNKTNNSISTIINPTEITNQTKAILLNALYFRAKWNNHFIANETIPIIFYPNSGQQVMVDTMVKQITCNYAKNEKLNATFLELPFVGKNSSIVFVLPNLPEGIHKLEQKIHEVLGSHNFTEQNVKVYLPKFEFEQEIDFKAALVQLGVTDVFDPTKADLSGIVGKPGDIHLERFRQKVSISLNEEGVNVASAKDPAVGIKERSLLARIADSEKEFKANHPFLYYIKIRDVITFVGRVGDPSKQ